MPTPFDGAAWKQLPPRRCCLTCRFFAPAVAGSDGQPAAEASDWFPEPGVGYCRHPRRTVAGGVVLLVRWREVNCRNDWGNDLWEPFSSN